jgi:hypothetical protein
MIYFFSTIESISTNSSANTAGMQIKATIGLPLNKLQIATVKMSDIICDTSHIINMAVKGIRSVYLNLIHCIKRPNINTGNPKLRMINISCVSVMFFSISLSHHKN